MRIRWQIGGRTTKNNNITMTSEPTELEDAALWAAKVLVAGYGVSFRVGVPCKNTMSGCPELPDHYHELTFVSRDKMSLCTFATTAWKDPELIGLLSLLFAITTHIIQDPSSIVREPFVWPITRSVSRPSWTITKHGMS